MIPKSKLIRTVPITDTKLKKRPVIRYTIVFKWANKHSATTIKVKSTDVYQARCRCVPARENLRQLYICADWFPKRRHFCLYQGEVKKVGLYRKREKETLQRLQGQ